MVGRRTGCAGNRKFEIGLGEAWRRRWGCLEEEDGLLAIWMSLEVVLGRGKAFGRSGIVDGGSSLHFGIGGRPGCLRVCGANGDLGKSTV